MKTIRGTGCPQCATSGFNPGTPAWFYLMQRPGKQQFGISNVLSDRMKSHMSYGWSEIESTGLHDGQEVLDTENALKKWLKKEIGLVPDKKKTGIHPKWKFIHLQN